LKNIYSEVISQHGLTQLRIAETEKYPHVTFFFDGFNMNTTIFLKSLKNVKKEKDRGLTLMKAKNKECKNHQENQHCHSKSS
ncbi:MAG: hypothetical protein Q8750_02450, partial [Candidatus Phytoplasma australasiaticum]|nr:hypothetical protein [Candidatus Phytoplasma australasiaticum]